MTDRNADDEPLAGPLREQEKARDEQGKAEQEKPETEKIKASNNSVTLLERLTVSYSQREDRLCVSAATGGGDITVFWLTQAFGNKLMSRLLDWLALGGELPSSLAVDGKSVGARASAPLSARQAAVGQAQAQAQQRPSKPVVASETTEQHLLITVDLQQREENLLLIIPLPSVGGE